MTTANSRRPARCSAASNTSSFIAGGDPEFAWSMPRDEWDAISLNYTRGTTGNPKGVVFHHRGAALMGYGNIIAAKMPRHPVYLWTLPMFHCNGWCFPWSLSVVAGTHVCLRWVRAKAMYDALAEHKVTHLCGAPIVMSTLHQCAGERAPRRCRMSWSSSPPPRRRRKPCSRDGGSRLQRHACLRPDRNLWPRRRQRMEGRAGKRSSAARARRRKRARACAITRSMR